MDSREASDAEKEPAEMIARPGRAPFRAMEFCPRCSVRLELSRSKMTCARCGYFMSCSDFY